MRINQRARVFSGHFANSITYKGELIKCVTTPAGPAVLKLFNEVERALKIIVIYTDENLKVGEFIEHKGTQYRISSAANWEDYGYNKYTAVELIASQRINSEGFEIT